MGNWSLILGAIVAAVALSPDVHCNQAEWLKVSEIYPDSVLDAGGHSISVLTVGSVTGNW